MSEGPAFTRIGGQMMPGQLFLRATLQPWQRNIELRLAVVDGRRVSAATTLIFKTTEECEEIEPLMTIRGHMAQELMDQLWQCGLRPTEGAGTAGSMAAVQAHLQDLRQMIPALRRKP